MCILAPISALPCLSCGLKAVARTTKHSWRCSAVVAVTLFGRWARGRAELWNSWIWRCPLRSFAGSLGESRRVIERYIRISPQRCLPSTLVLAFSRLWRTVPETFGAVSMGEDDSNICHYRAHPLITKCRCRVASYRFFFRSTSVPKPCLGEHLSRGFHFK